jgi:hypothetical protein
MAPINDIEHKPITKSKFGWTIIVFIVAILFIGGLIVWQLIETSPGTWCNIAADGPDNIRGACLSILLKLLEVKDHTIVGLLTILGIAVISVVAVALGVRISAEGPGDTKIDIGKADVQANEVNVKENS